MGGRTALLTAPYEDDPGTCGIPNYTQEELDAQVKRGVRPAYPGAGGPCGSADRAAGDADHRNRAGPGRSAKHRSKVLPYDSHVSAEQKRGDRIAKLLRWWTSSPCLFSTNVRYR